MGLLCPLGVIRQGICGACGMQNRTGRFDNNGLTRENLMGISKNLCEKQKRTGCAACEERPRRRAVARREGMTKQAVCHVRFCSQGVFRGSLMVLTVVQAIYKSICSLPSSSKLHHSAGQRSVGPAANGTLKKPQRRFWG